MILFFILLTGMDLHAHGYICVSIRKNLPNFPEFPIIFHQVPQQKNEYDCGIFVLYFMERFIEEAPESLKSKDLAMVKNLVPFFLVEENLGLTSQKVSWLVF